MSVAVYIAEMGRQEIVVCDREGQVSNIFGAPVSPLLPENFKYQPHKVVVDAAGRIYVLSKGVYQGIVYLEPDGSFIKFFGPNDVEMTLKRKAMKIWKSILSEQAASTMQTFNPIEYSNLFLSEDGYIYATAAGYADAKTESNAITKLNPLGINMLHIKFGKETLFSDVAVDESGVTTLLEVKTGVIYQLDKDGMLMFTMGGKGEQVQQNYRYLRAAGVDALYDHVGVGAVQGCGQGIEQLAELYIQCGVHPADRRVDDDGNKKQQARKREPQNAGPGPLLFAAGGLSDYLKTVHCYSSLPFNMLRS